MRTYFGVNYIAPIDILVPKEYESIGNDVKPPSKTSISTPIWKCSIPPRT